MMHIVSTQKRFVGWICSLMSLVPKVMLLISSSDRIGKSSMMLVWSIFSYCEGHLVKLFAPVTETWDNTSHNYEKVHDKVYRMGFVFLSDKRLDPLTDSDIFWFWSGNWWSITIDRGTCGREIGFKIHHWRVLHSADEVFELFDVPINRLHYPSHLCDASELIRFLCGDLSSRIEER